MARKDPEARRACERERDRRRATGRRANGLCPNCGKRPPAPGRSLCGSCAGNKRVAWRARYARLKVAGKPRRDRKARAYERERSRRQTAERLARGLCPDCGDAPPERNRRLCAPCAGKRRESERARYEAGKTAGKLYGGRNPEPRRPRRPGGQQEAPARAPRRRAVHALRRPTSRLRNRSGSSIADV